MGFKMTIILTLNDLIKFIDSSLIRLSLAFVLISQVSDNFILFLSHVFLLSEKLIKLCLGFSLFSLEFGVVLLLQGGDLLMMSFLKSVYFVVVILVESGDLVAVIFVQLLNPT